MLLLEAGETYAPSGYPDMIANANRVGGDARHGWGYHTQDGAMDEITPSMRAFVHASEAVRLARLR